MTKLLHKSFMAGIAISVGCIAYLSVESKVLGSFLFSIGLIVICFNNYCLFTGKVCTEECRNADRIVMILYGNLFATLFMGIAIHFAYPDLAGVAKNLCETKVHEGFSVIPRAILCNIMIFFAVKNFRRDFSSCMRIILCVMVFILSGMEHSIANNFYFVVSMQLFTVKGILYVLANIAGNAIGGILIYLIDRGA